MYIRFAAAALLCGLALPAEAKTRINLHFFSPYAYSPAPEYYYPGPMVVRRPRYYYYDYDYEEPDVAYDYEPDYYEPDYVPPKPRKALRQKQKKPAVTQKKQAPVKKQAALTSKKAAPVKTQKKEAAPANLISCGKATAIVTDYGFSNVKSKSCSGSSYAFTAERDGKPYVIKISAKSGELTEVSKQ